MKIHRIALAFSLVMFGAALFAQNQTQQQPQGRPALPPPYEVLSDHRVTFRFTALQAASVELNGDWPGGLGGRTEVPMVKDDKGVWILTVGPLQHYAILCDCISHVLPRFHQDR
jgi:hypothetical protein